jgi:predicted flap endonuclease-1-like 5' DNA nuclease
MSLLYQVVFATKCTSNHHRLALDALRHMEGEHADRWRMLALHHHQAYLDGAKAPDTQFKDFKNHVLHVREGEWGGAIDAANEWYRRTVRAAQARDWKQAIYSAGVMSHYVVDPFQPFHTHQTEVENILHAAVERSFSKSFKELQTILEVDQGGYPDVALTKGPDWLAAAIRAGAHESHKSYDLVVDHYDLDAGAKNPPAGLDQELKDAIARLIGLASMSLSRILDRTFKDADVVPPQVDGSLDVVFTALQGPVSWITGKLEDAEMASLVKAQYEEFQIRGKVIDTLTEDDTTIRQLHCKEVLKVPLATLDAQWPQQTGTAHGHGARPRITVRPKRPKPIKAKPAPRASEPMPGRGMFNTKPLHPPTRAPTFEEEGIVAPVAARPNPLPNLTAPRPAASAEEPPAQKPQAPAPTPQPMLAAPPEPAPPQEEAPQARPPKARLAGPDPIVDAPSIGPKTAARLEAIGVRTVDEFLAMNPQDVANMIDARHITGPVVAEWQDQAKLACAVPGLTGRAAQTLTACGVRELQQLAQAQLDALADQASAFALSRDGERLWNGKAPSKADVQAWIDAAKVA